MAKYILNIKTGKIHDGKKPCGQCRNCNESNKKYFNSYDEAVNFFEGNAKKGSPCGRCLREKGP